jgi:hypothetical protein
VCAHEIIHDVAHSDQSGFIFKLDYEKAYDRVDRDFLFEMLRKSGFSSKWLKILKPILNKGSVGVRLNDENSEFLLIGRGVRQGDPASPILFNFMAGVFKRMLTKSFANNQITGLMQGLNNTWVVSMQYADDTLLFLKKGLNIFKKFKMLMVLI